MKRIRLSSTLKCLSVVFVSCLVLLSCNQEKKVLQVVTVSGCGFIDNLSMHHSQFGSLADSGETSALLVSEGDLLMAFGEPDEFIGYIVYREEYGQHLEFKFDTVTPGLLKINDKIHSLYLDNDPELNEWIGKMPGVDLSELDLLYVSDVNGEDDLAAIKMIAEANPDIGLSLENIDSLELVYKIIEMFHPTCLIIMDIELDSRINELSTNLENLDLVLLGEENLQAGDFLYELPGLKSLIIDGWDPDESGHIQFEKMQNLESLTIAESGIRSMDVLGELDQLSSLYLILCESLTDISHIKTFSELQCLSLMGCDTLTELSVLKEIPSLQYLSFPTEVSQPDFDGILEHHQSLQGIELLECDSLTDLSSLTRLQELKALSISIQEIDYSTLQQLTGIELIVIDEIEFGKEEDIAALKEALPDAHIVPGGGFCMGSGWILVLLPVLLLAFGYRRIIRN